MPPITSPTHALTFGSVNLIGVPSDIINMRYQLSAEGDDADWGNPVPIEQKVVSWLQDGAIVALEGYDNREMYLRVRITADDDAGLAAGELALMEQTARRTTLVWTPPGANSVPSVFSVVMSHLEQVTDHLAELQYRRVYGLRISAEPFVQSADLVTASEPAPSAVEQTSTLIDNCNATTSWTAIITPPVGSPSSTAPILASGRLYAIKSDAVTTGTTTVALRRTGLAVSLATERYFRVDLSVYTDQLNLVPLVDGSPIAFLVNGVAHAPAVQDGLVYWFDAAAVLGTGATVNTFELRLGIRGYTGTSEAQISIGELQQSNVLGDQGTNRELFRTLPVAGSARAQGNLTIADEEDGLGTVLAYTCPSVPGLMQPSLREHLLAGPTETLDEDLVSGAYSDLADEHIFEFPASGLVPGGYLLMVRLNGGEDDSEHPNEIVPIAWEACSRQGTDLPDKQTGTANVSLPIADGWQIVPVAAMNLPPRKVGPDGKVRITLQSVYVPGILSAIVLDEAWIFNLETGRLTQVECGAHQRLWLDAATVATPVPTVWIGDAEDRSDCFHAGSEMKSFANHEFVPPSMNVFTVTSGSAASAITLSHYPRFHTHAVTP